MLSFSLVYQQPIHEIDSDCMVLNYMMDPTALYPRHFHPVETDRSRDFKSKAKHYRRTSHPVSYVIIDFGISRRYQSSEMPPLEPPILGGDKSAPEFKKSAEPCNPFPTDVYYVGNFIRTCFLEVIFLCASFAVSRVDKRR